MRTGAVVFLLLLMAVPVRAADPPPDLKALYELAPAPGRSDPFRRGKTPFGDAPGGARVRCAGGSRAPELGDRRHAGAVVGAAFRHLPVRRSDADRAGLHGAAAGAGRNPPGLPAGARTGTGRERAACAPHRRARADRERRAALARLSGPLVADARPAGRGVVSAYRSRDPRCGGNGWPRAGRTARRSATISSPPISTGSTGPSRASCAGTACISRTWSRPPE